MHGSAAGSHECSPCRGGAGGSGSSGCSTRAGCFENFLTTKVKVDGKVGNLGEKVEIKRDGQKITVTAEAPFSKRYLKYLTKKYLKKTNIRDWLHVISSAPAQYELRYFNINNDEEGDEDDE